MIMSALPILVELEENFEFLLKQQEFLKIIRIFS